MTRTTTKTTTRQEPQARQVTGAVTSGFLGGLAGAVLAILTVWLSFDSVESTSGGAMFESLGSYFTLVALGVFGGVLAGAAVGAGSPRMAYGLLGLATFLALVTSVNVENNRGGRVWPFTLLLAAAMFAGLWLAGRRRGT